MSNNQQLPVDVAHFLTFLSCYRNENGEYIELLKGKYYFVDAYEKDDIYHTEATVEQLIELYKLHHPEESTEYATKLHQLQGENKEIRGDLNLLKWDIGQYKKEKEALNRENEELKTKVANLGACLVLCSDLIDESTYPELMESIKKYLKTYKIKDLDGE